jgi:hypothetical protein
MIIRLEFGDISRLGKSHLLHCGPLMSLAYSYQTSARQMGAGTTATNSGSQWRSFLVLQHLSVHGKKATPECPSEITS